MVEPAAVTPNMFEIGADLLLYFCFFLGQCAWVLKCAAAAIRNPLTPTKNRREFIAQNWDIFALRMLLALPIYYVVRHFSIAQAAELVGWTLPGWLPSGHGNNWLLFLCLGLASDILIDSIAQSSKIPESWRKRLKEEIPHLPQPPTVEVKTTVEGAKAETTTKVLPKEGDK